MMQADIQSEQMHQEDEVYTIDIGAFVDDFLRCLSRFWIQFLLVFMIVTCAMVGYQNFKYMPTYTAKITYAVDKTGNTAIDADLAKRISGSVPTFMGMWDFNQDLMNGVRAETVNGNYSVSSVLTEETNLFTLFIRTNNYKNANIVLERLKEVFPNWVSKANGMVDLQIVDESRAKEVPDNPYSVARIVVSAMLVAAVVCVALILLYNARNETVRKESDMKKLTGKNCIISIPEVEVKKRSHNKKKELLLNKKRIDWGFRQAILTAQSRIEKQMSQNGKKVLLVSSTLPQEGKTLLAINLAYAFAQHQKKVLLIDGDMRNSSVGRIMNMPLSKMGLTDYLQRRASLDEIITTGTDFSVIHGGSQKGSNIQMISDTGMSVLMENLKKRYDYILIDTSSAYLFTDAALWAKYADNIAYVVKYDTAHQREIKSGMETLDQEDKILGYIVNRNPGGFSSYGYGKYGYGKYRYGRYSHYGKYTKYIELDEGAMNTEDTL